MLPDRIHTTLVLASIVGVVLGIAFLGYDGAPPAQGGTSGLRFLVNSPEDTDTVDESCTLREAIKAVNTSSSYSGCIGATNPGTDAHAIDFALGAGTPKIDITSALPPIERTVTINGSTGGATRVELHGPDSPATEINGLEISGAMAVGTRINGLVINNFAKDPSSSGLYIIVDRVVVTNSLIGTNADGTAAVPNGHGIDAAGDDIVIGGTAASQGNLISGNGVGVYVAGTIAMRGNRIGTNLAGTSAIGNQTGVYLRFGSVNSVVGGTSAGAGNLISGNSNYGILIETTTLTTIQGNLIGTQMNGASPLANSEGIVIAGVQNNVIGGTGAGAANTIAFNSSDGVRVTGQAAIFNQIRGNSIFANEGQGINNQSGGNQEISPPVIVAASIAGASGTASDCPPAQCAIDLYSDSEDEGRVYEGSTVVGAGGTWTFTGALEGPKITATKFDDGGNTSEFSVPFTIDIPTPTPTPTPSSTPTQSAAPTITPTETPAPTPTATATPTPTSLTETPTASGVDLIWGDSDCSGEITARDNQALLRTVLEQTPLPQTEPCPDLGATVDGRIWGDWDCSGGITARDNQALLRAVLQQSPLSQIEPCPDIALV